jgi:hypothetical protein
MYQGDTFTLDGDGCNDTYNYPYVMFGEHGLNINPSTSSPPSSPFGVVLYCSANSNGNTFDPNIQYGGQSAILSGKADFGSCYSGIENSLTNDASTQFSRLRSGDHLCILDNNELALVTLRTVSQTAYRVTGSVTLWKVLTTN